MSAHLMFCYGPQAPAVKEWMYEIGAPVSSRSPVPIFDRDQLQGLDHITFIEIVEHANAIPEAIWKVLRDRGAVILKVDDHWAREKYRVIASILSRKQHADA